MLAKRRNVESGCVGELKRRRERRGRRIAGPMLEAIWG